MKKAPAILILSGTTLLLAAALIGVLIYLRNQPTPQRGIQPLVEIAQYEPDSSKWGLNFPNQYSTFLLTKDNKARTAFGGSEPYSKLESDPRLVTLFAGMPFSIDYNEERGHMNSLTDVRETKRVNEKTPGTCYSCKTANAPRLWDQMGPEEFFKTPFAKLGEKIDQPVGCANCHEANTMRLIVTNPALEEALEEMGRDWRTFTRQEMRSVVCANCHVEYYFKGEGKYLTFPWDLGLSADDVADYYNQIGFKDWDHKITGAPMIKIQHPEYELYATNSTHYRAGVACADCHMPYVRNGAAKFSSHDVKSPLFTPEQSCGACHTDVAYVVDRVKQIQNQVREVMDVAMDALVEAIGAIEKAAQDPQADPELLAEARQLHREAQLRVDFINAENSMGFHNPEEALRVLAKATDLARQAQLKAIQASSAVIQARK
ncbi:MAG: ammonia-forming cytochrome c nitrite reductase subunit c552 [Anaerolineales bacterium]|nr:ammonia-forming cytochrome c nitrite reductase subunit c552 [Anaerolineales bacterium]MCS7248201.1 ammonia-forming cytochrome c nitrite reductase subunit c552 [Anaerolineales bacterium]MDW8162014.1 ammonia-forming cytochrome c nitrite reductase subunit c552 [Anaerolineales bacterium]MDW8448051.1 ammonia-forming cytochrome c nitrite reductase subunit c552 [Anaerolineales bacterium]